MKTFQKYFSQSQILVFDHDYEWQVIEQVIHTTGLQSERLFYFFKIIYLNYFSNC